MHPVSTGANVGLHTSRPQQVAIGGSSSKQDCGSLYFPNISDIFAKCWRPSYTGHPSAAIQSPVSEKRKKFVELAEARVNRAMKDLQLIGNLSNRSAYEFTEADVRKMFSALQRALEVAKSRFSRSGEPGGGEFKL